MFGNRFSPRRVFAAGATTLMLLCSNLAVAETIVCTNLHGMALTKIQPGNPCMSAISFCTEGRMFGSLRGKLTFRGDAQNSIPNEMLRFLVTGESMVLFPNGDQLVGIDLAVLDLANNVAVNHIRVAGGTGRYANKTGYVRVVSDIEPSGDIVSRYDGQLCETEVQ